MFESMEEIPASVKEFYLEDICSEPTGETVPEEFTYIDENGEEQVGTRQVAEYQDVVYIIEKPRYDLKSWEEVEVTVDHLKGSNNVHIKYCVEKAEETDRWQFHDQYLLWWDKEPFQDDDVFYIFENENIDDTKIYSQSLFNEAYEKWKEEEPVYLQTHDPVDYLKDVCKIWRDSELVNFVDSYSQKPFVWESLTPGDQGLIYEYRSQLMDYPQQEDFPACIRPVRPALVCDSPISEEKRWEDSIHRELTRRRFIPVKFNNVMTGISGFETPETIYVTPTVDTIVHMAGYVLETFVNGMVDVWWDADGGSSVQLTVQNLKPVYKAGEKYLARLYEVNKDLVLMFEDRATIDLKNYDGWPAPEITLALEP